MKLTLPAPAKLNLFLHIIGRRPDGYHELETVFQLLDYGDELDFSTAPGSSVSLSCEHPDLNQDSNLVLRAAALLRPYIKQDCKVHIDLHKRLPLGGGLGGGSSDAATTLLALNLIWHCDLPMATLMSLGLQLGADVPVFVQGQSAFASGIGEKLEPLALPEAWYLVITPACMAQTMEIFSHRELTRDSPPLKIRGFPISDSRNDCQLVACRLYPAIGEALDWLGQFAEARMTGTGASVFAAFAQREAAEAVFQVLPTQWCGFTAKGLNQSPVPGQLDQLLP